MALSYKIKDHFLKLIAEGYLHSVHDDKYIVCTNPDYREDNGSNPFLVYYVETETYEGKENV